jgi:hypothetical protein
MQATHLKDLCGSEAVGGSIALKPFRMRIREMGVSTESLL